VAIGHNALFSQNFTTATTNYNVAIGYKAGEGVTTGVQNTFIGGLSGDVVTTGSANVVLGYNADVSSSGANDQIVIGTDVSGGNNSTVRFGNSAATLTINLDGSDTSWAAASDERLKTDIESSTVGLQFINALRPVTYKWAAKNAIDEGLPYYDADSSDPCRGTEGKTHHGFIAQEVKAVIDANSDVANGHNIWEEDPNGTQQLAPAALIPMLVKAIQELSAEIETLKSGG
jgi:trimeric autotransporter adhesin